MASISKKCQCNNRIVADIIYVFPSMSRLPSSRNLMKCHSIYRSRRQSVRSYYFQKKLIRTPQTHKQMRLWNRMWHTSYSAWNPMETLTMWMKFFLLWEVIALSMCRFPVDFKGKNKIAAGRFYPTTVCTVFKFIVQICFLEFTCISNLSQGDVISSEVSMSHEQ